MSKTLFAFSVVGLLSFGTLLFTTGCAPSDPLGRHAISGTVNFEGAPVDGTIDFEPMGGGTSSGAVVSAGKFSIEQAKGLPDGKYRVRVNAPKPGTGGTVDPNALPGDAVKPPEELIPADWNVKSEQTIEVKAGGPFEFPFNITGSKK